MRALNLAAIVAVGADRAPKAAQERDDQRSLALIEHTTFVLAGRQKRETRFGITHGNPILLRSHFKLRFSQEMAVLPQRDGAFDRVKGRVGPEVFRAREAAWAV